MPDIVSGHAASVFDPSEVAVSSSQNSEQTINSGMAPPARPPRKSKKHSLCNEKDSEVSEMQW